MKTDDEKAAEAQIKFAEWKETIRVRDIMLV